MWRCWLLRRTLECPPGAGHEVMGAPSLSPCTFAACRSDPGGVDDRPAFSGWSRCLDRAVRVTPLRRNDPVGAADVALPTTVETPAARQTLGGGGASHNAPTIGKDRPGSPEPSSAARPAKRCLAIATHGREFVELGGWPSAGASGHRPR